MSSNTSEIGKPKRMGKVRTRRAFPGLCRKLGMRVGVEIGTYRGEFSEIMLEDPWLDVMYSIDPWLDVNGMVVEDVKAEADQLLSRFRGRSRIIQMASVDAAKAFDDESLGFVFIDADHRYDAVVADIEAWWPKTRPGGIFAGHDYKNCGPAIAKAMKAGRTDITSRCCVKKAVDRFIKREGLALHIARAERAQSWWTIKPKGDGHA